MKCENCGKNEVSFVYRSSINGRTEEHHLCQACAEKLGYTQKLFARRPSMMDSFFGNDDFFGDFFSPMPSLLGRMNRMLESPFDDFFDTMPAIGAAPVQEVQEEKKGDLMSHEEQSRFSYLRQLNAPPSCGTRSTSWRRTTKRPKRPRRTARKAPDALVQKQNTPQCKRGIER